MSIPYFSLFIGELPGKPDRLFATAARLRSNAGEAADIHSDVRRSNGFAPIGKENLPPRSTCPRTCNPKISPS